MKTFHAYLTNYLTELMKIKLDPLSQEITDMRTNLNITGTKIKNDINLAENAIITKNLLLKQDTIDKTLELKEKINTLINYQQQNIIAIQSTYTNISQRLNTYVRNLLNALDTLRDYYNLVLITPTLNAVVQPIKDTYNNIYKLLTQEENSEFIRKYFKIEKRDIPELTSVVKSPIDLSAKTNVITKVTQMLT
jgi:hypothetical protein